MMAKRGNCAILCEEETGNLMQCGGMEYSNTKPHLPFSFLAPNIFEIDNVDIAFDSLFPQCNFEYPNNCSVFCSAQFA
jgi:hypothetical protein